MFLLLCSTWFNHSPQGQMWSTPKHSARNTDRYMIGECFSMTKFVLHSPTCLNGETTYTLNLLTFVIMNTIKKKESPGYCYFLLIAFNHFEYIPVF